MKENLKVLTIAGFYVGIIVGTIDALLRVIQWQFQYFELYQTITYHTIIFTSVMFASYFITLPLYKFIPSIAPRFNIRPKVNIIMKNLSFIIIIFCAFSFISDITILNIPYVSAKAPIDKPNVILISMDTVGAKHFYSHNTTPNIDVFAEKAVVYKNAISQSSWTLPAHASIMTGKYVNKHGAHRQHQQLLFNYTTLVEILQENNYTTLGVVSAPYVKAKYGLAQGFDYYSDRVDFWEYGHMLQPLPIRGNLRSIEKLLNLNDQERTSDEVNQEVFKLLENNKDSTFFLFVHYFDAHHKYNLGYQYLHEFTDLRMDYSETTRLMYLGERYSPVPPNVIEYTEALYDAEIKYLDNNIGHLLNKIKELDLMDNTIIIITSDHGDEFYEHGASSHGRTLFQEQVHVPLILYYPSVNAGINYDYVETMSIFPTILELTNIKYNGNINATPLSKQKKYAKAHLFGRIDRPELDETYQDMLIYDNIKYITVTPKNKHLKTSMFNLTSDPHEQVNLFEGGLI